MMRPALALFILSGVLLTACDPGTTPAAPSDDAAFSASPNSNAVHRYEVTIENLTSGQPLSPAVAVTHTKAVTLFAPGAAASTGIQAIAENGDPSVAATALAGIAGVHQVTTTTAPVGIVGSPLFPSALHFEISAAANANYLSLATMLICTNDGFTGVSNLRLPHGSVPTMVYAQAYDAGTESNDEAANAIVGPCFGIGPVVAPGVGGGARVAEQDVIRMHPGIVGGAALSAPHDWQGPVARISVRRVK